MTQSLKQLEKILSVIDLKRQRLETDMAALRRRDKEILDEINILSTPLEQGLQNEDETLSYVIAVSKWADWRERKKEGLEQQRLELGGTITELSQQLQRLNVQISALETQRDAARKREAERHAKQQASQRLETWINAQ
jgi:chromosome segregation ATPase